MSAGKVALLNSKLQLKTRKFIVVFLEALLLNGLPFLSANPCVRVFNLVVMLFIEDKFRISLMEIKGRVHKFLTL